MPTARAPDPRHFDAHAAAYDRGRPPYPESLWARLEDLALLGPGTRVVELGAGTGQATAPMLRAGAAVTAVEPGPALAARLRHRCPAATVHNSAAEEMALPEASFDLAAVATAIHWLDLDVVLPKLHRAVVPGGHLAVWRTAFGNPALPATAFRERVAQITGRRTGVTQRQGLGELETEAWTDRLTASGLFAAIHVETFAWTIGLTTDQVRDLFSTFSNWSPAEVDEAARATDGLGGHVVEHYLTPLIVLERVSTTHQAAL